MVPITMYQNNFLRCATSSEGAFAGYFNPTPQSASVNQSLKKYRSTATNVPACKATSKASPGSCQPSSHGNSVRCAVLLTGKNSVKACTRARTIAWYRGICLGFLLRRRDFASAWQNLAHFVGIQPGQIVALQHCFDTIAVPLPERNSRLIVDCRFKQDGTHAPQRQISLDLCEQRRTNSMPAMRCSDIQGDDMRERRIFLSQNEPRDPRSIRRNNTIRAGNGQKMVQRSFRIGNPGREAGLIQPVQGSKVVRFIGPKRNRHPAILRQQHAKSRGTGMPHPTAVRVAPSRAPASKVLCLAKASQ